jgi:hypothetical protein
MYRFAVFYSNCAWDMWEAPRSVPESDDLNLFFLPLEAVDDTVGTADNFTQVRLPVFRHHAANLRKTRQIFGPGNQLIAEAHSGIGIVPGM